MREKILISACLVGENCRYNGENCKREQIDAILKQNDALIICPEVMGGLPTPRPPSEIQRDGRVLNNSNEDVTAIYHAGAQKVLDLALKEGITTAFLKSKSPMCGMGQIYDGTFSGKLSDGDGVLVKMLKANGIKIIIID